MWHVHIIRRFFYLLFISCVYSLNYSCYVEELFCYWFFTPLMILLSFKFLIGMFYFLLICNLCYVYSCRVEFFIHSLWDQSQNPYNLKPRFDFLIMFGLTPCLSTKPMWPCVIHNNNFLPWPHLSPSWMKFWMDWNMKHPRLVEHMKYVMVK
jgi:hypothetical protein